MSSDNRIGRFGLAITAFYNNGNFEVLVQSANEGIPIELVLMQLKAFLRNQENNYFNNFDKAF
ncbi:hypothetical protein C4573_02150 [Candidatus Woesearchaeota archaeon]|nr:MAG: hypothetical protein C4573_02150 [Candidatus Woesearchaeota archaeon]